MEEKVIPLCSRVEGACKPYSRGLNVPEQKDGPISMSRKESDPWRDLKED